jgi:hypothetical protein
MSLLSEEMARFPQESGHSLFIREIGHSTEIKRDPGISGAYLIDFIHKGRSKGEHIGAH